MLYMLKQKLRESKALQLRMLGKVEIELFSVFCSHAWLLACCICSYCWLYRVNGKRSCLCQVSWFNKKKEEALYVFGRAFLGFLWEVGMIAVESCWWSWPSQVCGKEGNFLYFWAKKGFCLWSYGGLEQWYFLYLLCNFFFFPISFVYIELCLRTANAITHGIQINKSLCCILQNMSCKIELQKLPHFVKYVTI